ncbi:MAG TPA: adenylate/guanylate cyclase domain-containing protein [Anaerolineales bacterium]|nr:adenylate/guanylate cyclase domain-containing protein [Anaerolineales bacterium]
MDDQQKPRSEDKKQISEIWHTYLTTGGDVKSMHLPWFEHPFFKPIYRALPSEPRCHICYIPFKGVGGFIAKRFLDVRPSPMNPHYCNTCERFAERFPGGAEVEVTILFADIRGSTQLAEKMDRQEYSDLIHRFYIAGTKPLYRNNALIEKFIGDGLTAFFPPAFAKPNHAQSAIKAGREILGATGHGEGKTPWIPVGVGINTGTAYIGSVQMEGGRADITLLGDAVNTAARICSEAAAGELLVGDQTMRMAGLPEDEHERRNLSLKGKQEAVDAWVLKP